MARWKVWRYGSSTVVTVSITLALKSVFPRTRPSPGKCLAVVASPAWAMPRMNATPWLPTTAGVGPNSRISCPMGAFWLVSAAGTTSMTGAKLRLTPAARNSLPQVRARPRSPAGGSMPCGTALGIVEKPGPCSAWTSPPSWLAATKNRVPPVACAEDSDCTARVTEATPATPAVSVAMKLTEPKWYALIAWAVAESSTLPASPTTNSCPTRWARDIRASTRAAQDRGVPAAADRLAAGRAGPVPVAVGCGAPAPDRAAPPGDDPPQAGTAITAAASRPARTPERRRARAAFRTAGSRRAQEQDPGRRCRIRVVHSSQYVAGGISLLAIVVS